MPMNGWLAAGIALALVTLFSMVIRSIVKKGNEHADYFEREQDVPAVPDLTPR